MTIQLPGMFSTSRAAGSSSTSNASTACREGLLPADTLSSTAAAAPPPISAAGERGLAQLAETQRIVADTERLGMDVLGQLAHQRGQLADAIEKREEAHESLSISSRLIRQMHRRAAWTKIALCLILSTLVGVVLLIVYFRWLAPHHDKHSQSTDASLLTASPPPLPHLDGRMLQDLAPPPATAVASRPLGNGITILLVLGVLSLVTCFWAYPRGLVVRTLVFILVSLSYLIIAVVLLTIPREDQEEADEKTDASTILRFLLLALSICACSIGLGCVLAVHAAAEQRAPVIKEPEPIEAYRLAP